MRPPHIARGRRDRAVLLMNGVRPFMPGFHNDGYTSTGAKATAGKRDKENPHIIAVDQYIPLKTMVYLNGYGFARAEDTGSAIKGLAIDLLLIGMPKRWLSEGERSRYIFWTGNPGVTAVSECRFSGTGLLTKKQYDKLVMSESQPTDFIFRRYLVNMLGKVKWFSKEKRLQVY